MEIKERLLNIISNEKISSSAFADSIGVQRSSISHILSGRNKPSLDFLQKILHSYPKYNAEWLIIGEGEMLKANNVFGNKASTEEAKPFLENNLFTKQPEQVAKKQDDNVNLEPLKQYVSHSDSKEKAIDKALPLKEQEQEIERIIWFYTDGTYKEFKRNIE